MRVAVVGLGAMGAATAWQLAASGVDVVGFDLHEPPHDHGSSHGESRVTRVAYHEDPIYVPLAKRAQSMWRQLEEVSGRELMRITGALLIGPPDGDVVPGLRQAAAEHGLELDDPGTDAVRHRFPHLNIPDGHEALIEPAGGVLRPEACIAAMLDQARRFGADLRTNCQVTGWSSTHVETAEDHVDVDAVVLAAGPWVNDLLKLPVTVTRQVQHWFQATTHYHIDSFPVFLVEDHDGGMFYGVPDQGDGLGAKLAIHHGSHEATHPDTVARIVSADEIEHMQALANAALPGIAGAHQDSRVCLYSNSPDQHFIIDTIDGVVVLAGFSGHGFKFAPAIGEVAAALAVGNDPGIDLARFRADRFG